jgi:hypothetical protein
MGFHTVATGFFSNKWSHAEPSVIVPIIFKSITYNGRKFDVSDEKQLQNLISDVESSNEDALSSQFDLITELTESKEFELYEDFFIKQGDVFAKGLPFIRLGNPHCCGFMAYIACIGDDLGNNSKLANYSLEQMQSLIEWGKKQIKDGRFPLDTKFACVSNCCS